MAAAEPLLSFWGKSTETGAAYPLLCHLLDTAAVARVLLAGPAHQAILRSLAEPFGDDSEYAANLVVFLAASHDIGKLSPGFQAKRPDLIGGIDRSRYLFHRMAEGDHGIVGTSALQRYLKDAGVSKAVPTDLAMASACHHGRLRIPVRPSPLATESPAWQEARTEMLHLLRDTVGFDDAVVKRHEQVISSAWVMTCSGLISVADWIASAEEFFPTDRVFLSVADAPRFLGESAERARAALQEIGFVGWQPPEEAASFEGLFPFGPNRLQVSVERMLDDCPDLSLLLIEAPTGIGKTEAALLAADRLMQTHRLSGMYIALPTQATSTQMFSRLAAFLERRFKDDCAVDLHLLHGQSDLSPEYRELKLRAIANDADETVVAHGWFTARKRGLLSPFGVGTVDQGLMAALQVRHVAVRLFGLAGKVVIIDEVHAYDTYMSRLLDTLLAWLHVVGSRVVLLSATLPKSRRKELVAAFASKIGEDDEVGYPSIAGWRPDGSVVSERIVAPSRTVVLDRLAVPLDPDGNANPGPVVRQVLDRLAGGGCCAWICNTVGSAQQTYRTLKEIAPADVEIHLLHARYPLGWRQQNEQHCLRLFGKEQPEARPARAILVATQIIEQSLDLDFDLMVSELAPVDLMIQRIGRLHRHPYRQRPEQLATPTFLWIEPQVRDGVPGFGPSAHVYEPYILIRSWLAIDDLATLDVPDGISPLIEQVYDDSRQFEMTREVESAIRLARTRMEERVSIEGQQAHTVRLPLPGPGAHLKVGQFMDDDGAETGKKLHAQTRLTPPSVTVVCAFRTPDGGLRLPGGTDFDPEETPDGGTIRVLRMASVALQHPAWVFYFLARSVPEGWRQCAHLKECRLAIFEQGRLAMEGVPGTMRLARDTGIEIVRSTSSE